MLLLTDFLKKTPKEHKDSDSINKSLNAVKDMIQIANESIKGAEKAFQFWQQSASVVQSLMEAQRQVSSVCHERKLRF